MKIDVFFAKLCAVHQAFDLYETCV